MPLLPILAPLALAAGAALAARAATVLRISVDPGGAMRFGGGARKLGTVVLEGGTSNRDGDAEDRPLRLPLLGPGNEKAGMKGVLVVQ